MEFNLHVQGRIDGGTVIVVRRDLDYAAVDRFWTCVEQALQPPPGILYVDLLVEVERTAVDAAAERLFG
ncbi:hypothetical protein ACPPVO_54540 [Dactylosporangium sp. McL0621]|uniref:hypothetical protein n=1 Tax=Dactylosporangium sp. McL0621 TaxID=3415678 RepID=UPI003CF4EF2A